jgi:hypothetical protein
MYPISHEFIHLLLKTPNYLDTGSGSVLLQLLIAGLLGLAVTVGASWSKIKKFFRRGKKKDEDGTDDEE